MSDVTHWIWEDADEYGTHYVCADCGFKIIVTQTGTFPTTCERCGGEEK